MPGFFHHIGSFMLLAATVLLIVTCISAPVVNDLALMKVHIGTRSNGREVSFGTFGYCQTNVDGNGKDICTRSRLGYSPAAIMSSIDGTQFSDYAEDTTRVLTKVMILHPIACGINFIAFLLALGAGMIGSFLASLVALLAFIVTAVAVIIDFVLFSIIRSNVNDRGDVTGTRAHYSAAAWTTLVSAICSLIGAVIVFFTCCSARSRKRRSAAGPVVKDDYGYAAPARRRRRFW
jgi:uncharacterized membrane protein